MLTQSDQERERYEARLKFQRDERSRLFSARQEGGLVARVQLCQRLLKEPVTPEEQLLALSLNELERLANTLEQRLLK